MLFYLVASSGLLRTVMLYIVTNRTAMFYIVTVLFGTTMFSMDADSALLGAATFSMDADSALLGAAMFTWILTVPS